jgi:hypothetical protein
MLRKNMDDRPASGELLGKGIEYPGQAGETTLLTVKNIAGDTTTVT